MGHGFPESVLKVVIDKITLAGFAQQDFCWPLKNERNVTFLLNAKF
jgi:hypothetical protein